MTPATLSGVVDAPGEQTEDALLEAHARQLATVIDAVGSDAVIEESDLSADTIGALAEGDVDVVGDLDLMEAASVLALAGGSPDAPTLVAGAREDLLFGMTTGVLNVDTVAAEVRLDVGPRAIQGMLEGRHPMTVRQYVALQRFIASRER